MTQQIATDPTLHNNNLCWQCNGKTFWGKASVILESVTSNQPVHFYCYDREFDAFDWRQEPHQTWDELMAIRCHQLRDKYDYLRLWYSGGYDSHTMLMKFVELGIHVDEIFTWYSSATNTYNDITNAEVREGTVPTLQRLSSLPALHNTKVTVINMDHQSYKTYYEDPDWLFNYNVSVNELRNVNSINMYRVAPQLWQPHNEGKKVANVMGFEKPRLIKHKNEFYTYFWDSCFSNIIGSICLEPFYVTGDLPELHAKQSHMVKNWIKYQYGNPEYINHFFRHDELGHFNDEWNLNTGRIPVLNPVHRVWVGKRYDLRGEKQLVEVNKAKQFSESAQIVDNWRNGVLRLQAIASKWFPHGDALNYHAHGVMSKKYSVGT